jgi:hypothetical protein
MLTGQPNFCLIYSSYSAVFPTHFKPRVTATMEVDNSLRFPITVVQKKISVKGKEMEALSDSLKSVGPRKAG